MQKKICKKPAPGAAILVEIDEMRHYLGSKKNKLWIWKAYRRETGELIDWECGGRDKETLSRLIERLSRCDVELYCAKLFIRTSQGIGLTEAGEIFYREAQNIKNMADDAIRKVRSTPSSDMPVIRVGTSYLRPCKPFLDYLAKMRKIWSRDILPAINGGASWL